MLVAGVVSLCVWCVYRFFKKRRPKQTGKKKDGKAAEQEDEDFLVENIEEEDLKDVPDPKARDSKEYLGKLQYKVRER